MAIETFENLPIIDTGGRSLISALKAKKISFPNDGADFGNSGDQLRSLGNGGVEWAAPGMPTYEQTEQAISDWLDAHPEATTTVADGAITDAKLRNALKDDLSWKTDIDKAHVFETVADMKQGANLSVGAICHTNGFYASGDGGAAWYLISDTGTANETDVIACGELFAHYIETKPLANALQFGMKNDGSADISVIFNDVTERYSIEFPRGSYKVSNTLMPKNNIIGVCFARFNPDGSQVQECSNFVSDMNTNYAIIEVANQNTIIRDIAIYCNSDEIGLLYSGDYNCYYCENVTIVNVSNVGIRCAPPNRHSRYIYIDNVSILGALNYPNSTGIFMTDNTHDSKISNIEIMRVQKGLMLAGICYGSNFHIWGGQYGNSGTPSASWINGSIGIEASSQAILNDVYLDSFNVYLKCTNNHSLMSINNILAYCDDSIPFTKGYIFDGNPGNIALNGGSIRFGSYLYGYNTFLSLDQKNVNSVITFIESLEDIKKNVVVFPKLKGSYTRSISSANSSKYNVIAVVPCLGLGTTEFDMQLNNNHAKFSITFSGNTSNPNITVTKTIVSGFSGYTFGYTFDSNLRIVYIWMTQSGSFDMYYWVSANETKNIYVCDYGYLRGLTALSLYAVSDSAPSGFVAV